MLRGRSTECAALDRLLEAVRAGEGRALVLRGEAGAGKSALLEHLAARASDCRVAFGAGVQSEMELAFAGLHQLCAPWLDRLARLPAPQRDALSTAFGLGGGAAPDRFLVGLAVLSLLSDMAEERPLVCVVDDVQWLDEASRQALGFVARRLVAESVAVVFAVRASEKEPELAGLAGLPELVVEGLRPGDARELLASVVTGPIDEPVRDRIIAETRGNPLALLELPRGLTATQLAGGFGMPDAGALSGRIEASFRRRLESLPVDSRRLVLVAAAEPIGEPVLVWRAAERLGLAVEAVSAVPAGLVEFGAQVRFRHPLVRSAVYRAASPEERRSAHRVLAEATDPEVDPDRRAWHRAHATSGFDEDVAAELERSAGRAQARGGLAAAAAFLERAATLTPEPARRATRALAAAHVTHQAGAPDAALGLLATAQAGPLDELQRARVDLLRGEIEFTMRRGSDAPPLLLEAAKRLEPLDGTLARETYLEALSAALVAGRLAGAGGGVVEVAKAARAVAASPEAPRATDLLLDGLAMLIAEGHAAATPMLKRALRAFRGEDISREEGLRWLALACRVAMDLWDDESWELLSTRQVELARDTGALAVLFIALRGRIGMHLHAGELAAAASLVEEVEAVAEATGSRFAPYEALALAVWRGREAEASALIEACANEVVARGEGMGLSIIRWASAVLYNAFGRHEEALAAAQQASAYPQELLFATWGLVELVEAAVRGGEPELAADALRRLSGKTQASGTDWALGIEACSRALLSQGAAAERLYREAIERLARTRVRVALARAHLLYGEWLGSERRRPDARTQLHAAHEMFTAMGIEAFAQRAARELPAADETARTHPVRSLDELTAREAQIARLARDGLSNREIGARLFISPSTVDYHLRKVFTKLGISTRHEIDRVLPAQSPAAQPV